MTATNKTPDTMTITNKGELPPPMQRLAAELRVRIFGFALEHSAPLSAADGRDSINISLLRVSKQFYEEGLDAFYEVNTIRIHDRASISSLSKAAGLFRNLEFVHPEDNFEWAKFLASSKCKSILRGLKKLMPKLKTVTVACEVGCSEITVRQILARTSITEVTCTNIGEFQLHGELSHVRIQKPHLVAAWKRSRSSTGIHWLDDLNQGMLDYAEVALEHPHVTDAQVCNAVARKNPHIWLALHGAAESLENGFMQRKVAQLRDQRRGMAVEIYEAMSAMASEFQIASHKGIGPAIRQLQDDPNSMPIDLLDSNSDPKLLEWATELMALNLLLTPEDIEENQMMEEKEGVFTLWHRDLSGLL